MRPIAIVAYDRPMYFEPVLQSLRSQTDSGNVSLFLDGYRKNMGNEFKSQDRQAVEDCERLFRHYLPDGKIFKSKENLGVAFNQRKARETMFQDHESVIFLEDDAKLEPYYIRMLNNLMDFLSDDKRVGMVNCFGEGHRDPSLYDAYPYIQKDNESKNKTTSYKEQETNKDKLKGMDHLWSYGFFRHAYEKVSKTMDGYYKLIPPEYRARPHADIMEFWRSLGSSSNIVSSQDSGTATSLILNDFIKVSTYTNNFTYIGEWGEHSRPDNFDNAGWNDCITYDKEQSEFIWDEETYKLIRKRLEEKYLSNNLFESFQMKI